MTASQMRAFLVSSSATMFGHVSAIDKIIKVELSGPPATELGARKTLIYRWESLAEVDRRHGGQLPPPGYDVHGPGSDHDDDGNWRAAPPLTGT